ncbi:Ubiquitin-like protein [Handroanthus impetiginosus]|uniref:Ubiquitin-like protein n=1 Tax=Handroanthus impetiginosus TaxID=429701 RepID=A0A2G9G941_9LAMI|nr:Ubiquitin-like protein [Handroanthus impetiginosus]
MVISTEIHIKSEQAFFYWRSLQISEEERISPSIQEEYKSPTINMKFKGQDGNEAFFKIKSTQLKKLTNAYCDHQSVDLNSLTFLFDDNRLGREQTFDRLKMEDGDEMRLYTPEWRLPSVVFQNK